MMMTDGKALEIRVLSKTFGNQKVLDIDYLEVLPGQIHGLVGANGSGKSTLVKILSGYHEPDPGSQVRIFEKEVSLPIRHSSALGLGIIHQDLGLISDMSVLENLSIGVNFDSSYGRPINWQSQLKIAREFVSRLGLRIDVRVKVGTLSKGARTIVALARTLRQFEQVKGKHLLLLDEPTVAFDRDEVTVLFEIVRRIAEEGNSVIFISHRLPEVLEICDIVTVLKDGRIVERLNPSEVGLEQVIASILGQPLGTYFPDRPSRSRIGGPVLKVEGLKGGGLSSLTFQVSEGEVLGITGLEGMGQDDLPYLLVGLREKMSGNVSMLENDISAIKPNQAWTAGIAVVPSDRGRDGLWLEGRIFENFSLPILSDYLRFGRLDKKAEFSRAEELMQKFRVRGRGAASEVISLSGGNQQKVVMARAFQSTPKVLVLHQPTVGVDVGSRRDLVDFVFQAASVGTAIIYVSSEYEELASICDRVLVLENGSVVGEIRGEELCESAILQMCHAS